MSNLSEIPVVVATAGSAGEATGFADSPVLYGRLHAIHVNYGAGAPNTTTIDADEVDGAGRKLLDLAGSNTDATYYPSAPVQDNTGAEVTYDGTNPVYQPFVLAGRKVRVTVAASDALTPAAIVTFMMEG